MLLKNNDFINILHCRIGLNNSGTVERIKDINEFIIQEMTVKEGKRFFHLLTFKYSPFQAFKQLC